MAINFDHQRDRISTNSGILTVNTTGAITIPVGVTGQRPGPGTGQATGQIRFNSELIAFEGYDGSGWTSLGGVIDNDKNTYIIAKPTPSLVVPGTTADNLYFVTAGFERAVIDENGNTTFNNDLTVGGNVQINGTLTVDGIATLRAGASGSINLGDDNTDNVVFQADVNSSIIPNVDATYNLGSSTQNWLTAFVQTLDSNTDVITVDLTGALTLPVGTTLERPTPVTGMIRFNTDDQRFEAYDGTAWTGVGGVIDVDQNTFIRAETSPGANNNDLDFFTDGVQRLQIDETGDFLFGDLLNKFTIDFVTGDTTIAGALTVVGNQTFTGNLDVDGQATLASANIEDLTSGRVVLAGTNGELEDSANLTFDGTTLNVTGDIDVTGNVTIGGNITIGNADTDAITVTADFESNLIPNLDSTYDLGSATKDWRTLYVETITNNDNRLTINTNIVDVDSTGAFILPVGSTLQRPTAEQGMVRYNTTDSRFEAYNGVAWTGLGGVIDVDQNTYIIAETSPGANNNDLDFYTDGVQRLQIDETGDLLFGNSLNKLTVDFDTGNTYIAGTLNVVGLSTLGDVGVQDLVVSGDLTVSGTTTYINTTTLNVGDNIITLNADVPVSTAPTENAGIEINRGSEATVSFIWDETLDRWTVGTEDIQANEFYGTIDGGTF